eukprot:11103683-Alexandrium_andersonii.AAC.1
MELLRAGLTFGCGSSSKRPAVVATRSDGPQSRVGRCTSGGLARHAARLRGLFCAGCRECLPAREVPSQP